MLKRILTAGLSLALVSLPAVAAYAQPPQVPEPPPGFLPVNELPPGQGLPAAPFLVGAYVFFLLLMVFYLWTIWRRLGKVQEEMRALQQKGPGTTR
jgi:type VI protein secretion system component VasF